MGIGVLPSLEDALSGALPLVSRSRILISLHDVCRCAISAGQGSDPVAPVVCQEVWSFDDEAGIARLVGLQALCPEVHLAKHVLVQVDDKQRQTAMWTLQAMNECATSQLIPYCI